MMGFAGQLSLGHSLYVGVGAYVSAAIFFHYGIGPLGPASGCRSRCASPSARRSASSPSASGISGVYFALLTIAFCEFTRIGFRPPAVDRRPPAACSSRWRSATRSTSPNFRGPPGHVLLRDSVPYRFSPHSL